MSGSSREVMGHHKLASYMRRYGSAARRSLELLTRGIPARGCSGRWMAAAGHGGVPPVHDDDGAAGVRPVSVSLQADASRVYPEV